MASLLSTIHYFLVDHPTISNYQWIPNKTPGASLIFLIVTISTYLTLTLLFHKFPILPSLPPTTLRLISAVHNLVLCFLSLIMVVGCTLATLHQTPPKNLTWCICFPTASIIRPNGPTFFWAHVFYFSKIMEFVDTLLILLSGSKSRRLSFLHVYHHALVVVMCYLWLEAPQSLFPVGLVTNAAVHVVMYVYYLLSALGYRVWWKKMVTNFQITQFLFGYLISGLMWYLHFTGSGCEGVWVWGFNAVFTTSLLVLFVDFHVQNYSKKKKMSDEGFVKDKEL